MSFEIHITPNFLKKLKALAKRHRSIKEDLSTFTASLEKNPMQGNELSPGIRKIRMTISSKGRGKSGGVRVITYSVIATENDGDIYLIDIYDKTDSDNVDVGVIRSMIEDLFT